jgi:hypothetical protein
LSLLFDYCVKPISRAQTEPFILNIHYAKRWPSISYAFGLIKDDEILGVVTYGTPPSSPLRSGIAGKEYSSDVLELNRLVLRDNIKNQASFLVSRSIKYLPQNRIIISFADISQNHTGYVYQACNFLYCGLSEKRTDWKIRGREHLHGVTVADEFRGQPNRSKLLRQKYGDDFYLAPRPRKHRYLYIRGTHKYKKNVLKNLRYPLKNYPKS